MTSREFFIVGVRIVGLFELAKALDYLITAFDMSTGLYTTHSFTIGGAYAHLLVHLAVGIYLLSGARDLVRLVLDRPATKKPDHAQAKDEHEKV